MSSSGAGAAYRWKGIAMTAKQRRDYYNNGKLNEVYGIWNGVTKRFVYGIRESSPRLADKKLRKVNPKGSYCYRYEARRIPDGWVNPQNARKY